MKAIRRTILVAGMLALSVPLTQGWQKAGTGKGPGGPAQVQQPSGPVKAPVQQQTGSPQVKAQQQTGPMQKPTQHQAGVRTMEASRKRLVTAERGTYEWHAQRKNVAQMMIRSEHTYRMQIAKIDRMQAIYRNQNRMDRVAELERMREQVRTRYRYSQDDCATALGDQDYDRLRDRIQDQTRLRDQDKLHDGDVLRDRDRDRDRDRIDQTTKTP